MPPYVIPCKVLAYTVRAHLQRPPIFCRIALPAPSRLCLLVVAGQKQRCLSCTSSTMSSLSAAARLAFSSCELDLRRKAVKIVKTTHFINACYLFGT
jgi:hypothetical protein